MCMALTTGMRIPNGVVEALKNDKNIKLFHYSGKFFLYENNYYKEKVEIEKWLNSYINDKKSISTSMIDEIVKLLRYDSDFELDEARYQIEPERYINFQNGILDLYKKELIPHIPDIIFFYKIPYNYNPEATSDIITEKLIENFIKTKTPEESEKKRIMLFEYLGVVISNIRGLKNFLFIQGLKDTGKSTYCGLIMRLLGIQNYVSLPLVELSENSFHLHEIIGKKANILTETDDTPIIHPTIKYSTNHNA